MHCIVLYCIILYGLVYMRHRLAKHSHVWQTFQYEALPRAAEEEHWWYHTFFTQTNGKSLRYYRFKHVCDRPSRALFLLHCTSMDTRCTVAHSTMDDCTAHNLSPLTDQTSASLPKPGKAMSSLCNITELCCLEDHGMFPLSWGEMIFEYKSLDFVSGLIIFPQYHFKPRDRYVTLLPSSKSCRIILYCIALYCIVLFVWFCILYYMPTSIYCYLYQL